MSVISESNSTQRNWNLDKKIPLNVYEEIYEALIGAPSKQNLPYYKVHIIQNRDLLEKIHANTMGYFDEQGIIRPNDQVLANMVIAFEAYEQDNIKFYADMDEEQYNYVVKRDQQMAVGIASGYVNLIAHQNGLKTGYCACYQDGHLKTLLNADNDIISLLGVGYPDTSKDKNDSHIGDYKYLPQPPKRIKVVHK
tara:strand:- start:71 stop:655 length:585 start_codon:yes stop_codon:yes gene_type:complete